MFCYIYYKIPSPASGLCDHALSYISYVLSWTSPDSLCFSLIVFYFLSRPKPFFLVVSGVLSFFWGEGGRARFYPPLHLLISVRRAFLIFFQPSITSLADPEKFSTSFLQDQIHSFTFGFWHNYFLRETLLKHFIRKFLLPMYSLLISFSAPIERIYILFIFMPIF